MANSPYQHPDTGSTPLPPNGDSHHTAMRMAAQAAEPWKSANPLAIRPPSSMDDDGKSAAEVLIGAAELLRNAAETGEKVLEASQQLDALAHFLESHSTRASLEKGKRFFKRHPLESVIALVMAAFLLGRAISKLEEPQIGKADARE